MTQSHRGHRRLILLSAEAWAAAQELAEGTGSSPSQFIEIMLFDFRDTIADATPAEDLPVGVIPISQGLRLRRRRSSHTLGR